MFNAARCREVRLSLGMSQARLGELVGVSMHSIFRLENGTRQPKTDELQALARVLGITPEELMSETGTKKRDPPETEDRVNVVPHFGAGGTVKVPVYDDFMSVCAGHGTYGVEGTMREELEIPVWLLGGLYSPEPAEEPFIVTIRGDSMAEADIPDGSQVLVNPILESHDGDVIVAEFFDDWMIKWIYWDRDGGGELRSASTKYPVRRFTREDVENGNFKYKGKVCRVLNTPRRGE